MQYNRFIILVFIFAAIAQAVAKKTNVIIIFPDDQGTTDLGIYGVDKLVQTPTLDRRAAGGALDVCRLFQFSQMCLRVLA